MHYCIFISVKATFYKNALIENLLILYVLFCAFEPIDSCFETASARVLVLVCMFFQLKLKTTTVPRLLELCSFALVLDRSTEL